jgi:hypothetical protein
MRETLYRRMISNFEDFRISTLEMEISYSGGTLNAIVMELPEYWMGCGKITKGLKIKKPTKFLYIKKSKITISF